MASPLDRAIAVAAVMHDRIQGKLFTFVPQKYDGAIAATGDSTIQVSGTFTLHGTPHDLSVPMQIHIDGGTLTAKTHFIVPYVKWGLKDPSVFILKVAKEVDIDLTLIGKLSPAS